MGNSGRLTAGWRRYTLPELCPACRCSSRQGFCRDCAQSFVRIGEPCPLCALPGVAGGCAAHGREWQVVRTWAPFQYAYPLDRYLQALKFARGRTLGRALGLLLGESLHDAQHKGALAVDLLVPVPLHPLRLRERGYNQAIEIARSLGAVLDLSLAVSGVLRSGEAVAQSSLGARARRSNVVGAFRVRRSFAGLRVAVVDDVVTTGATVNALAAALLAAGARRVEAVAVARTVALHGPTPDSRPSGTMR